VARIYKRPGSPYYQAEGRDAYGERWRKSTGQTDRIAAHQVAVQFERRMAAPDRPAKGSTLIEAIKGLARADKRAELSDATQSMHQQFTGHLLRVFGGRFDLHTVGRAVLDGYADQRLEEGASRHTVHKELSCLRQCMRGAGVPWEARWMPDLGDYYVPRERWLPRPEYEALLDALSPTRRDYVVAWCNTGMRRGELYRLTPGDIDVEGRRVFVRGKKGRRGARERWVPLNASALEVFARRARWHTPFPVWGNVLRDLPAACARAQLPGAPKKGIPAATPNDLRRTFASWCANAGVSLLATARMMGHGSTRMVELVYARLGMGIQRDAVAAIDPCGGCVPHEAGAVDAEDAVDIREGTKSRTQ
jgi:integrase